ncbi:MAG TPA: hypothetical protein VIK72_07500 [Clostridiaceae bacterium]
MKITKVLPLNLIFDYPINWSKYKVLRDFIQNFYDSVSYKNFNNSFSYKILEDNILELRCKDVAFNYNWLIHIGASSKREDKGKFAGYFGEGFKMAALCALRDYAWNVTMSSQNWSLEVTSTITEIDTKKLTTLAYMVEETDISQKDTVLRISNFKGQDLNIFIAAVYTFYYKENPLFGQLIWEDEMCAIYRRSKLQKPKEFPYAYKSSRNGIVFGAYQALGALDLPFVFCLHSYRNDDRDRNYFSDIDEINILVGAIRNVPPSVALVLLEDYKKYWYTYPKSKYGYDSFYTVIKNLIKRLALSSNQVSIFITSNPRLLVAEETKNSNIASKNRRKQALSWLRVQDENYNLVQDSFQYLGVNTLEEKCNANNGFTLICPPNSTELKYINVLEVCVSELFKDFLNIKELPVCQVIANSQASWNGMADCLKLKEKKYNKYGYRIRYELPHVSIKRIFLNKDNFDNALSTYLHELTHAFGGDSSVGFSRALTKVLNITIFNLTEINKYKKLWESQK